jgi:hypothetical protein
MSGILLTGAPCGRALVEANNRNTIIITKLFTADLFYGYSNNNSPPSLLWPACFTENLKFRIMLPGAKKWNSACFKLPGNECDITQAHV